MSSATSTDRSTFRPWQFFVLAGLFSATAAVFVTRETRPSNLILLSLSIGAVAVTALALYRTLLPLVEPDDDVPERIGRRTRAALEREKMLVLRSIKELEFDRAMGKVADHDFEEMIGRLRSRAVSLIRQLDAGPHGYQELIERELQIRLTARGISRRTPATAERMPVAAPLVSVAPTRLCDVCETTNDKDAKFCKECGHPFESPSMVP